MLKGDHMKYLLTFLFLLMLSAQVSSSPQIPEESTQFCKSSREYITTFNFFTKNKEFGLNQDEIKKTSFEVSKGCTNASQRFIKIFKLLTEVGIDTRTSIKYAQDFAQLKDQFTEAFITLFKFTYNPDLLDLNVLDALEITLALTKNQKDSIKKTMADFEDLVEYCLEHESMELPHKKCASIAMQVTLTGQKYKIKMAKSFIQFLDFLQENKKGPQIDKTAALSRTLELINYGPLSYKNFSQAYSFAISKTGLKYSTVDAMKFATQMAKKSVQESKK